jgi:hypothetical protein
LDFDCADVALPAALLGPDQAALVGGDPGGDRRGLTCAVDDRVDQGTAGLRQQGLGRTAVVGQRAEARVVARALLVGGRAEPTGLPDETIAERRASDASPSQG